MNAKPQTDDHLTLELLDVIGKRNDLSQRHLAIHMGVALGLANSYLKRCVRKGFVKITKVPANRYLYYLTPKGFAEKARLTASYLSYSFSFYREAGDSCIRTFDLCRQNNWNRILLCGVSDLAEIALLRGMEMNIEVIGIYDLHAKQRIFLSKPVWQDLDDPDVPAYDACVLTDITTTRTTLDFLMSHVAPERILIPDILRVENRETL